MVIKQQEAYTITPYGACFMLLAFKIGYHCVRNNGNNRLAITTMTHLQSHGYVELLPDVCDFATLMRLTDKGVAYVKDNFIHLLISTQLRCIYPILDINDEVIVTKDLENGIDTYVQEPKTTIKAGTYTLKQIDRYTLLLVSKDNEKFRVKSYECRDALLLSKVNIGTFDVEFSKRMGKIDTRQLSNRLIKLKVDSFKIIDLVNTLKGMAVAQGRWGK